MTDKQDIQAEGSLSYLVHRLDRALRADLERRLAAHAISLHEWGVLAQCAQGVETPAALADCLEIDRSAVTRLLDTLEGKGLVKRGPHPTDKRSVVLTLTEPGGALYPRLLEHSRAANQALLAHLAQEEAVALLRSLRALVRSIPGRVGDGDCGEA